MFKILGLRWNIKYLNIYKQTTRNLSFTTILRNQNKNLNTKVGSSFKTKTALNYSISTILCLLGLGAVSIPLYRALCARTGFGGQPITDKSTVKPSRLKPVDQDKRIRVKFSCETSDVLPWKMTPEQKEVYVLPGETALAFYKAKNYSENDIIGMATYSITPGECSPYFNKIQCFCFEEQKLNAGEEVDMPVFFFIDPEFVNDSQMQEHTDIILHYSFFKATYAENGTISKPDDNEWSNKIVDEKGRVLQPVKTVNVRYDE
ncbi:related to Cytochrome c oxidase assembly protein COX11, mitochondrial [Hanseniaspora guilliermondii]|uniref:Related to Cytochrome c oxidase assembly protein COX11, mitochondrial n=1 Tax=Hanseniaspora guilliermondii TaxID=56406 RepID=A0A1L0B5B5_9ASCO|nr:related to Cytochrome c oxidase assembly protein COX11, mitochondrial [Hanseniaspora guilliermondii]